MTGNGEDNGTESNVWVNIIGPKGKKLHTGRLFLKLAQKESFTPGSVETFSLEAIDVGEVRQIEVRGLDSPLIELTVRSHSLDC